jgi:biopolymer transport protein TolQ
MIMGNALWHLIDQSDAVSKLVLLILLGMSIVCWAIFFYKLVLLQAKKKQLHKAIVSIKSATTLEQASQVAVHFAGTMPGYFLSHAIPFLRETVRESGDIPRARLNELQWGFVQENNHQIIDEMMHQEESYFTLISTIGGIATLLGLFGTIWGLIHSFVRISELKSADILTVAPGIAEALITTLVGLMVAIPAIVMFNFLSTKNREVEQRLVTLADRYSSLVQKLYMQ